jgi:hypothetical protein
VLVGEPLGHGLSQLGTGPRLLSQQRAAEGEGGPEVDAVELRGELGVSRELGVEHRLHEGPQRQGVVGGDQVDGAPHDDDAHECPVLQLLSHLVGVEGVES